LGARSSSPLTWDKPILCPHRELVQGHTPVARQLLAAAWRAAAPAGGVAGGCHLIDAAASSRMMFCYGHAGIVPWFASSSAIGDRGEAVGIAS